MLLVEEAISSVLRGNAPLVALVAARIYPGVLPQTVTYPAIAYRLVDRESITHLAGRSATGLARSGFRFFSTAKGMNAYSDAKRLDEALRLCLAGFHGTVSNGASPANTLDIQIILPGRKDEFYDDPTQTWQVRADYDVWASEQVPTEEDLDG